MSRTRMSLAAAADEYDFERRAGRHRGNRLRAQLLAHRGAAGQLAVRHRSRLRVLERLLQDATFDFGISVSLLTRALGRIEGVNPSSGTYRLEARV
jgi:hypothetical protein